MDEKLSVLLHAYALISIGGILITIFLASIIQGIMVQVGGSQVGGNLLLAIGLYLVAWLCLGTGALLFFKGKKLVHYVMMSG